MSTLLLMAIMMISVKKFVTKMDAIMMHFRAKNVCMDYDGIMIIFDTDFCTGFNANIAFFLNSLSKLSTNCVQIQCKFFCIEIHHKCIHFHDK